MVAKHDAILDFRFASILRNLPLVFNKRLLERPSIGGKITVKFAIDEFGKVIFCEVIETTIKDPWLENKMDELIKNWQCGKIDKPGDVTEVVYPFIFSPNAYPHMLLYLLIATSFAVILGLFLTHQN